MLTFNTTNTLQIIQFLRTEGFPFPRTNWNSKNKWAPRRTYVRKEAAHSGELRWTLVKRHPDYKWDFPDSLASDLFTFPDKEGTYFFGSKHRAMDLGKAIRECRCRVEVTETKDGFISVELIEDRSSEPFSEDAGSQEGLEAFLAGKST